MEKFSPVNDKPIYPSQWNDARYVLFRKFRFESYPDIVVLKQLVKHNLSETGNQGILRSRLLGTLDSIESDLTRRFWSKRRHPKTWRIRCALRDAKEWFHRKFNTWYFKSNAELFNMATEVCDEIQKRENR